MNAAQRIRELGFRKWYERELLHCHANLVLLLLATLSLLACVELYGTEGTDHLTALAGGAVSLLVAIHALRRYLYLLKHAEFVADQAICARCDTYGRLLPIEGTGERRLGVRCRHCQHTWHLDL
jgi:hypothetical protein